MIFGEPLAASTLVAGAEAPSADARVAEALHDAVAALAPAPERAAAPA